ncbi:hypothetical protein HMN09_01394600 [Mycena chlorophos]|uniref:Uncharacterized protein n=1 Tax=Mycena chlorophos TaxID=658473 RepID=A0A8H6VQL5_MYCCL|nr:hypothetical protein HMN09_01394600 [Mycena chlorophos]
MLWLPAAPRKARTRSGRIFAEFFQSPVFSIRAPLLAAIQVESDNQEDAESDEELEAELSSDDLDDLEGEASLDIDDIAPEEPPRKRRKTEKKRPVVIADLGPPPTPRWPPGPGPSEAGPQASSCGPGAWAPASCGCLVTAQLPVEQGSYRAGMPTKTEFRGAKKARGLDDFLRMGFQLIKWNGINGMPLLDSSGRIFAVLAGRPNTVAYALVIQQAFAVVVAAAAARAASGTPVAAHRRGLYAAVTVGLSYGQGQTAPCVLGSEYPELAEQLTNHDAFQEIASFGSSMLAFWAPRLYQYYRRYNAKLDEKLHQPRPFARSVFSAATFNLGPWVWTFKHRDVLNLPFGWCAITALGNFDPTKGGHLVLWDLRMVVEFPPGATILIPSATLVHSNTPVSKHEHRASFTQYTAGGLFRYVDNDFRTEAQLASEDPALYERRLGEKESRYEEGMGLWSSLDELVQRAEALEIDGQLE